MVSAVSCKLLAVPAAYTAGIFMEGTQMANIKKMIRKDNVIKLRAGSNFPALNHFYALLNALN